MDSRRAIGPRSSRSRYVERRDVKKRDVVDVNVVATQVNVRHVPLPGAVPIAQEHFHSFVSVNMHSIGQN